MSALTCPLQLHFDVGPIQVPGCIPCTNKKSERSVRKEEANKCKDNSNWRNKCTNRSCEGSRFFARDFFALILWSSLWSHFLTCLCDSRLLLPITLVLTFITLILIWSSPWFSLLIQNLILFDSPQIIAWCSPDMQLADSHPYLIWSSLWSSLRSSTADLTLILPLVSPILTLILNFDPNLLVALIQLILSPGPHIKSPLLLLQTGVQLPKLSQQSQSKTCNYQVVSPFFDLTHLV